MTVVMKVDWMVDPSGQRLVERMAVMKVERMAVLMVVLLARKLVV